MANVPLKNANVSSTSQVPDSSWVSSSPPPSLLGSSSMVNMEDFRIGNASESALLDTENEENDGRFHQPEKKRRLLPDQVQFLEKSFDLDNKLEPERKLQLAKQLGLQPRQVSVWFQNRRARFKNKLLEKDYDSLKSSYDQLKAAYDTLHRENERLKNEVHLLKGQFSKTEQLDPDSPLNLLLKKPNLASAVGYKRSTEKSDISADSDSQHCIDGNDSHFFEQDPSDFSQDEDDDILGRSFFPLPCFPKLESECSDDYLQPNSDSLGFPFQDQGTWFWQY